MTPIVYLDDLQIAGLLTQRRIIPCERRTCTVCGQAIHDQPGRGMAKPRCPHGCGLTLRAGIECRLCGDPVPASSHRRLYCATHIHYGGRELIPDGGYTMRLVDRHFHAADGTGSVTQYAATQKVEAST